MNFTEYFKQKHNIDINTLEHKEQQRLIIKELGYNNVKRCLPFSKEEITKALKTDIHLNNLPIEMWDNAAGFECKYNRKTGCEDVIYIGSELTKLCNKMDIYRYSLCNGVCILKECARMTVEE